VVAAGEAKWTNKPLDAAVLTTLVDHKLPALRQAGLDTSGAELILASRRGFTAGLRSLASRHRARLLTADDVTSDA
jgi:hypothetical protein